MSSCHFLLYGGNIAPNCIEKSVFHEMCINLLVILTLPYIWAIKRLLIQFQLSISANRSVPF